MNFAEFFAGVGLVREGLTSSGWKCIWANDISSDKRDTYVKNFGENDFHLDDIWNIATSPDSHLPNDIFLYTASFPCTDLSVAGGRAGLAGAESGTLNAVLSIIKSKNQTNSGPQVIMLENVNGFLTSHQGKDVSDTASFLSELGYVIDLIELDAALFTPQSRPRVFLIAVKKDLADLVMHTKVKGNILDQWWALFEKTPEFRSKKIKDIIAKNEHLNWGLFDIPKPKVRAQTLDDIIDQSVDGSSSYWWNSERKSHLYNQMNERHQRILDEMCLKEKLSYGTVYRRMRAGKSMAELRTDGIAGCLRTPRGGSSKQILIQAGYGSWKVRLLTPREYARLQGVRDSFILPSNDNKGYFAMGDAVCVPVIEHLAKHVLRPLYEKTFNK